MRNEHFHIVAILAALFLLLSPLAGAELVINKHSVDFTASSPYNEQLKLCAGESKTDLVTVENTGTFSATYDIFVRTDYPGSIDIPQTRVQLAPGEVHTFAVTAGKSAAADGTFAYEVTVTNEFGRIERLQRTIRVDECQTASLDISPASAQIGLCQPTAVLVTARNVGPYAQDYELHFGQYEHIVQADRHFRLDVGQSRAQEINLTFPCDAYGVRVVPVDLFTQDGALGAHQDVAFSIRNEYDAALDVPTSLTVCAGAQTTVNVGVENLAPVSDKLHLSLEGPKFVSLDKQACFAPIEIDARSSKDVALTLSPRREDLGQHRLSLEITAFGGVRKQRSVDLTVEDCYDPAIALRAQDNTPMPGSVAACCGDTTYLVNVRNDGTREQAFHLSVDGPSFLVLEETTIRLAAGQNANVPLRASLPCTDGSYDAAITVSPVGQPQVNRTVLLRIDAQTQRTCHAIEIKDDELRVRDDAVSVPVQVRNVGIAGGKYAIDLDDHLFSVQEKEIPLDAGESTTIHLVPKSDLSAEPKGRYVLQPSLRLVELGIPYQEHIGISLDGKGFWAALYARIRSLPWASVGACGWTIVALAALVVALLALLLLVYAGKVTLFPDGLPRRALAVLKSALVLLIVAGAIWIAIVGMPPASVTHERAIDNTDPTVIEWYQGTQAHVDLAQYFDDPDKDALTYRATQPRDVKASISGSKLTLVADEGFAGTDSLAITAIDAKGAQARSPDFTLHVIAYKRLGVIGTLHMWCLQLVIVLKIAALVLLLLLAVGIREERFDNPRKNVLVVVPQQRRSASRKPARQAARSAPRKAPTKRSKASARTGSSRALAIQRALDRPMSVQRLTRDGQTVNIAVGAPSHAPAIIAVPGMKPSEVVFVGAKGGSTVHAPTCMIAKRIPRGKRRAYSTKREAVSAGLVPCKICRPFEGGI